jgi:hypothetical protein
VVRTSILNFLFDTAKGAKPLLPTLTLGFSQRKAHGQVNRSWFTNDICFPDLGILTLCPLRQSAHGQMNRPWFIDDACFSNLGILI